MTILLHLKSFFISESFSPTISSTITLRPCLPFCISRALIGCVLRPQLRISVSRFPCVCLQHTPSLTYAFPCLGDYLQSYSYITYYRVWRLWCFSLQNVTTSIFNIFFFMLTCVGVISYYLIPEIMLFRTVLSLTPLGKPRV